MLPAMKLYSLFALALLSASTLAFGQAPEIKAPEDVFRDYPNRLAELPPGWIRSKPLRLEVCFNLKHAVNTPEADAFLKQLFQTITSLPAGAEVRIERPVTPVQYAYCASMFFRNWEHYWTYERSQGFLTYYREVWKPAVTGSSENLAVLDQIAAAP
jgi:hypothetical protein